MVQLGETAPAREVRRHGERRPTAEGILDEAGQVAAGPDVDEEPQAVGVHGLDRLAERDGAGPLRDGQLADRLGLRRHPSARGTRVDRQPGGRKLNRAKESAIGPRTAPKLGV